MIGSTSNLGAIFVPWKTHNAKADSVVISYARTDAVDELDRRLDPIVWDVASDGFQARFRNAISNQWEGAQPVRFYWVAYWD